ncbi:MULTISPECIES: carbohydrate-binding domain-containing protein [unclassified Luteococcus]|uniref:carbohydrate-binding domain-containing protein n=1 Tax=unclassified Luteococcus TaxID=2639923 RepID=UPI00313C0DF7
MASLRRARCLSVATAMTGLALIAPALPASAAPARPAVAQKSVVTVSMRSDTYRGTGARVRVALNKKVVTTISTQRPWRSSRIQLPRALRAGDELQLLFDNDARGTVSGRRQDRTLYLRSLVVDGKSVPLTSAVYDQGHGWKYATDGRRTSRFNGRMLTDGALRYRVLAAKAAPTKARAVTSATVPAAASTAARRPAVGSHRVTLDQFRTDGTPRGNANQITAALDVLRAKGGGTLVLPDRRLVVDPLGTVDLPSRVALVGSGSRSELALSSADKSRYVQLLRINSDQVRIENLRLTRANAAYGRMLTIAGGTGIWLSGVTFNTGAATWGNDFSAIDLINMGNRGVRGLTITGSTFENTQFGLLSSNARTGRVDDVLVTGSTFRRNHADDLEFNSPNGVMATVHVVGNSFADNLSTSSNSGFGVGMARVTGGSIVGNSFTNYAMNPVHIEDRSSGITVSRNTMTKVAHRATGYASGVIILSGARAITVEKNTFDTTKQGNGVDCVFLGPGSSTAPKPSGVTLQGNTYRLTTKSRALGNYGATGVVVGTGERRIQG